MRTNTSAPYAAPVISWWTQIKPKSLRVRLALLAALLLCLIQMGLSAAFYAFTSNWLLSQVDDSLLATAAQVAAALQDGEPLEREDFNFQVDSRLPEGRFFIRVIDQSSGEILSETGFEQATVTALARSGKAAFETLTPSSNDNALIRVYTLPLSTSQSYALQIGQSLVETLDTQTQILRLLVLMLVATGLLALASGWFLAHRALIPVSAITRTARDLSAHDLSRRIDLPLPDDELGQLAQTFNRMLARLEGAFQQQRQFTADAAHELRTPLSIMQMGLEVALSQPRSTDDYRAILENLHEEVLRLSQLTNQLLLLARLDAHTLTMQPQSVDLSLLLNTVTDQLAMTAEHKGVRLERDIPPNIHLNADETSLIQLALNLLENAVKYTPSGGRVGIKLNQWDGQVCFSIADTGVGIAPEHRPHIFERFYRADRARSRQQGGVGLGLAIAQQIAQLHRGSISVTSQPGAGSEFIVTLPIS